MISKRMTQYLSIVTLIAIMAIATPFLVSQSRSIIARPASEGVKMGLEIYKQSERAPYATPDKRVGLAQYHRSEWGLNERTFNKPNAAGMAIYKQSERALYAAPNNELGLALYHRSEWGLDERTAEKSKEIGQAIYFASERSIPLRDLSAFNAYQRSEWFGE